MPLSSSRENYIIDFLEREACTEIYKVQALSESVFTNALISAGSRNIDTSTPMFTKYLNFELPSTKRNDNIGSKGNVNLSKAELQEIKRFLVEAIKKND